MGDNKDQGAGKVKVEKETEDGGLTFDDETLKRCFEGGDAHDGEIFHRFMFQETSFIHMNILLEHCRYMYTYLCP